MTNENINIYFKTIEDTLTNLQKDFDFLYESSGKKQQLENNNHEQLLLEIENLKKKILYLENSNDKTKTEPTVDENNNNQLKISALHIEIEKLKIAIKEFQDEKNTHIKMIKALRNEICDLKGNIRVFCRFRSTKNISDIELFHEKLTVPYNNKVLKFQFDRIFTPNDLQSDIFKEFNSLIESVFEGYKICIFAYGQTGSGKTYTMIGTKDQPGIIFKALEVIFNIKNELKENIRVLYSSFEIYNEEIKNLNITDNFVELVTLQNAYDVINLSLKNRKTEKTECNEKSSRSHLICQIKVEIEFCSKKIIGDLCFVDLAGSERLNKSKVEGLRLKETQSINKSLSSLGDVFMAILRKDSHVPYRNSKLTFFLQEFFTGKSRVVMILNVNADHKNETISTLRFGAKVSECKLGKVEKNVIHKI